ncbi:putative transcription factor Ken [Rhipicephalus microplus]|uniref:putative transcription factor Ken n=1 Tax=Rhipicephalus microplus TaxID=6941 RepID=UPI003F6D99B3
MSMDVPFFLTGVVQGGSQSSSQKFLTANVRHYQCHLCSYSSIYKQALNRHYRIHTGERPYKCELCPQTFAQKCNMKLHLQRHGACPYKCRFCNRIFRHGELLHEHVRQEHAESA